MTPFQNIARLCPTFLFATLIILSSCKKTQLESLPAASTNGSNTIGCLIDGKAFVGADSHVLFGSIKGIDGYYSYASGLSVDGASLSNDIYTYIFLGVRSPLSVKQFLLGGAANNLAIEYAGTASGDYNTDSLHQGTVTITRFDTINHIYSGTFEGVITDNSSSIKHITSGRFDLKQAIHKNKELI